ncbi:transcription factor bHLH110-like [Bidens hawaiensis]|uniref:transcription factor bHLH110-like n=1 Tax=Bidens hawaiensis TaxID=980011 RepID=UPI00404A42A0
MGEHPNYYWSLNGKLQPPPLDQQTVNPTLITTPAYLPPSFDLNPLYHFESSLLMPTANRPNALADHHHHEIQDFPLSWSQLTMIGLANDLEQYNFGAGHVGEVKQAYNLDGTSTNGNSKRASVHHSSTQSSLKVRKEKSGRDRIYALHQLVSPFGKDGKALPKDLASKGLCLVPVTCMDHINTTNTTGNSTEFWTLTLDGGFLELGVL